MWALQGVLATLHERQRTGLGRLVECSLLETAIGFSLWTSAQWLADHEEPTRQGSRHRRNAPYQRMQTKDGYLMVGATGDAIWARCAEALGHPEWCEDPRLATNAARMANRDAMEVVMNACSQARPPSIGSKRSMRPACRAVRPGLRLRADVRRPAGPPPRSRAICERPGTGRGAGYLNPDQDRREYVGAPCRHEARPAQRRDLWPPRSERGPNQGIERPGRIVMLGRLILADRSVSGNGRALGCRR